MQYRRLQCRQQVPSWNKLNVLPINYSVTEQHTCTSGQLRNDARSDSFTFARKIQSQFARWRKIAAEYTT